MEYVSSILGSRVDSPEEQQAQSPSSEDEENGNDVARNGNGDASMLDDPTTTTAISPEDRVRYLEEQMNALLTHCAENLIDLPDDVKSSLSKSGRSTATNISGVYDATSGQVLSTSISSKGTNTSIVSELSKRRLQDVTAEEQSIANEFEVYFRNLRSKLDHFDLRVENASYTVTNSVEWTEKDKKGKADIEDEEQQKRGPRRATQDMKNVQSSGMFGVLTAALRRFATYGTFKKKLVEKQIMSNVNLYFETGKMYLVLGGPASGKSTVLKYISNSLLNGKGCKQEGSVTVAGLSPGRGVYWNEFVGYIDQIERLHAYLTVKETFEFAFNCRYGGTHMSSTAADDEETRQLVTKLDEEMFLVTKVMDGLGLSRVKDTFVGDQERVRGVSGGEKKRVTVGEMLCIGTPISCMDEISTGLDAATTYDITRALGKLTRMTKTIKIVSLLQPPPETVANFDELILVADGYVIYSGPLDLVIDHFNSLGYAIPERMDVADWLQALPTPEGGMYMKKCDDDGGTEIKRHMTAKDFHEAFYASELGKSIFEKLKSPPKLEAKEEISKIMSVKYRNPWYKSLSMVCKRELLLYWRDKYQIKAKIFQTILMGTIVGTLFFQSTGDPRNVLSVCFQSMFYAAVGSMVLVIRQFPERSIFYKQQDASFFPSWAYVTARSIASFPVALTDAVVYGSFIFWLVGLAYNDGASIANYFIFLALLFTASLVAGLLFSTFPSIVPVISMAQALNSLTAIVLILFSGFTVQPNVIPVYYIWLYYINPFAWLLRGLLVNQFDSGKYDEPVPGGSGVTEGELTLINFGLVDRDGEPYTLIWAAWGVLFCLALGLCCMVWTACFYNRVRFATGQTLVTDKGDETPEELDEGKIVNIPFTRVDLTFRDLHYYVMSSISKEQLELLKGIDGVVYAGKMTALMGSSGAGKTTLMDVIAMRKTSGEITGAIKLNGHPQDEKSFRRCMGYVVQFDTQSAELTVRETLLFSAKLRLDESDPAVTTETIGKFVDQTLIMLELSNIQNLQIGTDDTGGLSFEQRKRLSIAVEVVSNPSIVFLDEPTSGLDARAAAIVMRGMKRIAEQGRAVCATIHQPSIAIFNSFDRLILLKRGGEVVFQGDLGTDSINLINYFQRFPATKPILPHENPATWMLTTIGAGNATADQFDYAGSYAKSKLRSEVLDAIDVVENKASDENLVSYSSKYATSKESQRNTVLKKMLLIYYRSPSYNTTRVFVSGIVALLFSTVYITQRDPTNEAEMNSRVNSVYISILFLMVNAQNTVLSVFEKERNMFYIHRNANMYRPGVLLLSFTVAELPFILYASMVYCVLFYFIMGFAMSASKFFLYYLFTTFALAISTFTGQMMMSLVRDSQTAQGLGGIIITCTSLFSGVLINPAQIPKFWIWLYWILTGHWIFEGIFMSQFNGDQSQIQASCGTPFYAAVNCTNTCGSDGLSGCYGSAELWIDEKFPSWTVENVKYDAIYLAFIVVAARCICWWALNNLNYQAN